MDYFNFGNFDPDNLDIAFSATNQYSNPASELETRKQLSYPLKELKDYINNLKDYVDSSLYPVGSIYMSVNSTDPSTLFPGTTWEQLKDRFLLGAGDTYTAGDTGGEASHTLTVEELPAHNHGLDPIQQVQRGSAYEDSALKWGSGGSAYKTGNTGGGNAHNNMPPYICVFMWRRVS